MALLKSAVVLLGIDMQIYKNNENVYVPSRTRIGSGQHERIEYASNVGTPWRMFKRFIYFLTFCRLELVLGEGGGTMIVFLLEAIFFSSFASISPALLAANPMMMPCFFRL